MLAVPGGEVPSLRDDELHARLGEYVADVGAVDFAHGVCRDRVQLDTDHAGGPLGDRNEDVGRAPDADHEDARRGAQPVGGRL